MRLIDFIKSFFFKATSKKRKKDDYKIADVMSKEVRSSEATLN